MRVFASALLVALCLPAFSTTNLFRFLEDRGVQAMHAPDGTTLIQNRSSFENYYVTEKWGQKLQLLMVSQPVYLAELTMHQLIEVLGLHRVPRYPILVSRASMGLPALDDGIRKFWGAQVGPQPDPTLPWIPALIEPVVAQSQQGIYDRSYNPAQLAELFKAFLIWHLLGGDQGTFTFVKDHLLIRDIANPFVHYRGGPRPKGSLSDLLWREDLRGQQNLRQRLFPSKVLLSFTRAEQGAFLTDIARFLTRLENLVESGDLERLLAPMLQQLLASRWPDGSFAITTQPAHVVGTARKLREEVENYLSVRVQLPRTGTGPHLPRVAHSPYFLPPLPAPFAYGDEVVFPQTNEELRTSAKQMLFSWALSSPDVRKKVAAHWAARIRANDPIAALLRVATVYDNTLHLVLSEQYPKAQGMSVEYQPQFFLNASLKKTLLVVSKDDYEARLIEHRASAVGREANLEVFSGSFGIEHTLTLEQFRELRDYAVLHRFQRVVICELRELNPEGVQLVKDAGLEVIHLDHHDTRWNKYSVGEQFSDMIGYLPGEMELLTFLRDRSHFSAFPQLGLAKRDVERYLRSKGEWQSVERSLREYGHQSADDKGLIVIEDYEGNMEVALAALAYLHYPKTPQVLLLGRNTLRFSGSATVVESLRKIFSQPRDLVHRPFFAGDLSRTAYWRIYRPRAARAGENMVEEVQTEVRRLLGVGSATVFADCSERIASDAVAVAATPL